MRVNSGFSPTYTAGCQLWYELDKTTNSRGGEKVITGMWKFVSAEVRLTENAYIAAVREATLCM